LEELAHKTGFISRCRELTGSETADDTTVSDGKYLKTSKTYMWIGIVLVVVGIIMGILFGKTALLISLAGMVFVIIGYAIR
jgi:membrane protein CcdC involved in cytochrome C biogenesis